MPTFKQLMIRTHCQAILVSSMQVLRRIITHRYPAWHARLNLQMSRCVSAAAEMAEITEMAFALALGFMSIMSTAGIAFEGESVAV